MKDNKLEKKLVIIYGITLFILLIVLIILILTITRATKDATESVIETETGEDLNTFESLIPENTEIYEQEDTSAVDETEIILDETKINENVDMIRNSIENFDEEEFNKTRFEHFSDQSDYWDFITDVAVVPDNWEIPSNMSLYPWGENINLYYAKMIKTLFDYLHVPDDTIVYEVTSPLEGVLVFTDSDCCTLFVQVESVTYYLGLENDIVYIKEF